MINMNPFTSDKIQEERATICNGCEYVTTTLTVLTCSKCGCPIKSKAMLKVNTCPEGKWPKLEEPLHDSSDN